jgi:hypothetical protein
MFRKALSCKDRGAFVRRGESAFLCSFPGIVIQELHRDRGFGVSSSSRPLVARSWALRRGFERTVGFGATGPR